MATVDANAANLVNGPWLRLQRETPAFRTCPAGR